MNNTVPYGIEDISIPEYSAKVKLQAAIRREGGAKAALQKAEREADEAWKNARNYLSAIECQAIMDEARK